MATPQRQAPGRGRQEELVLAARKLFDERGMQDAPIEEIARSVGIARGLIYREFSSKEELFVVTVTSYLDELVGLLEEEIRTGRNPTEQLECSTQAYGAYCQRYPAFLDCSLSLMRRPARELRQTVSEDVWLRLGVSMSACIDQLTRILHEGRRTGDFEIEDVDLTANVLWTQMLGAMHLARIRIGMRLTEHGPGLFAVSPDDVVRTCVHHAMAAVGARGSR